MFTKLKINNTWHPFDLQLIVATLLLVIIGLIMIYDASVVAAFRDFEDRLYFFKNQLIWASLGFIALAVLSLVDYHKIIKFAPIILVVSVILLVAVLIPGIGTEVNGARRWINLAGFTLQPSELAKLAVIIYLVSMLTKFQNYKMKFFDVAYVIFAPTLFLTGLVLLEPDLGTALILVAITLSVYFIGNGPLFHFLLVIPALVAATVIAIFTQQYRLTRLKGFLNPNYDPQGATYQINQILTSLGNGGLFGVGLGGSRGKFDFIPEVHSDAIFAVVAEELGFVGVIFLLSLILFLTNRAMIIARTARDFEGMLLAGGIAALISVQSFLNLASIVTLVPLTGIPLPFISYGGSSLLITMICIGILVNIKRQA